MKRLASALLVLLLCAAPAQAADRWEFFDDTMHELVESIKAVFLPRMEGRKTLLQCVQEAGADLVKP